MLKISETTVLYLISRAQTLKKWFFNVGVKLFAVNDQHMGFIMENIILN
jgi:hypothetical protein